MLIQLDLGALPRKRLSLSSYILLGTKDKNLSYRYSLDYFHKISFLQDSYEEL